MNILLTLDCSLDCSYCFARSRRAMQSSQEMSLSELDEIIEEMDPACDTIRLMGGEPTLHSQYAIILQTLKERGFRVVVFTNGLQSILRKTAPFLPDEILLNLNDWLTYSHVQQAAIGSNLSALGDRTSLATTITDPAFDLSPHRELILKKGLRPVIRLGLAQPILGGDNIYLRDVDLPAAHQAVAQWAAILSGDGIRLSLDCGFMRCHFNDAEIETMVRAETVLNFDCAPTLDIGPGLKVWRCFAFSAGPGIPWQQFRNTKQLSEAFNAREKGVCKACKDCVYFGNRWCHGGCLARTENRKIGTIALDDAGIILKNAGVESI